MNIASLPNTGESDGVGSQYKGKLLPIESRAIGNEPGGSVYSPVEDSERLFAMRARVMLYVQMTACFTHCRCDHR
jgi:hypothetical protein